jgi:hypothetical protein
LGMCSLFSHQIYLKYVKVGNIRHHTFKKEIQQQRKVKSIGY